MREIWLIRKITCVQIEVMVKARTWMCGISVFAGRTSKTIPTPSRQNTSQNSVPENSIFRIPSGQPISYICAVTNGDISGRYEVFSLWVLITDSTIGWVRVRGWVAERKRKHRGQGIEGLVAKLKGLDCVLRIPSYSLKNTEVTQNNDWSWNINRHQIFRSWGPLSLGCLPCGEPCGSHFDAPSRPLSRLRYKGPVTTDQVMPPLQTKRRERPDSSAKLVPNCCKSLLNSVRPQRPLS